MKKIFLLLAVFIFSGLHVFGQPTNYTYNYDFWREQVASPDAYRPSAYILGVGLGINNFNDPQGLFVRDNRIYVCDSGNNRIVVIEVDEEGGHSLVRVVTSVVIDGEESPFAYPMDIFEDREGFLYITDTNNRRVLKLDGEWNFMYAITQPDDESFESTMEFLPVNLVVDFAGRIFVRARNVNKGLMEFDNGGEFVGYMGANKVSFSIVDYIWKTISTQEQRERMDLFIPIEYSNLALDSDGFIYVTNQSDMADPVRRLNAMGQDILIRNGYEPPIGDLAYGNAGGISGPSRFIDVVAFPNDSYACFDRARGRIFMYDFQGNLLYAFGSVGNKEGYFLQPVALDRMGDALYALDSRTGALTRLDLTGYGRLINTALNEYKAGRYEASADLWEQVLKMNGNYDLAYIGIGRAALRQGEYRKAMGYYRIKHFREGYGKAFQLYRKQWMEENLWKILLVLGIVIVVPFTVRHSVRIAREIREA